MESRLSPLERSITNRLGNPRLVLGTQLKNWEEVLGSPSTIPQKDGGNTFFYWPEAGVGVFCHPHFRAQYRWKARDEWVVTSIFIPLTNRVHPRIPPVDEDLEIGFDELLFESRELIDAGWHTGRKVRRFERNGVVVAIEIRKPDSWLGDYD